MANLYCDVQLDALIMINETTFHNKNEHSNQNKRINFFNLSLEKKKCQSIFVVTYKIVLFYYIFSDTNIYQYWFSMLLSADNIDFKRLP